MEKTILGMQEKLAVLNKSVSDEGKQQLAKLEQEVERLDKEVRFACYRNSVELASLSHLVTLYG